MSNDYILEVNLTPNRSDATSHFGVARDVYACLLYTSDAADERSSVDLGGRRIIKKKKESILTDVVIRVTVRIRDR